MSAFFADTAANLGSIGVQPVLPSPPLPTIVAEWAALLPLVCHLASQRDDYITTGDVALMGRLSVGIFPKLGTLSGIARLLRRGTKFLDYASTKGDSSRTVWDVNWGSVFPCANGAAIAAISKSLRDRNTKAARRMPETLSSENDGIVPEQTARINDEKPSETTATKNTGLDVNVQDEDPIRRYQLLHVYQFHHTVRMSSIRQRVKHLSQYKYTQILRFIFSICIAMVLFLWGCYGTGVTVICVSVSELAVQQLTIRRPSGYLRNNENHDACMLVAPHENATEWHLYIGDRGIVDTLLNKPMFMVPEGKQAHFVADLLWVANLLQLAAMTFVAAQKGWDGVCLVALLGIHWLLTSPFFNSSLADRWLEREGIDAKVESYLFGGRTALIGSIQLFSQSPNTDWMDRIIVPHPRRTVWLRSLRGETGPSNLGAHDAGWVNFATESSFAAAEILMKTFGGRISSMTA
ncbi:hypothetical protein B0I35DRAFT_441934 [Stachybotrys elegans]|uniref:Uncharacterized protein n=1 Tax=Stachybotrys elegans TaxID=80388 RepID=A0A8K0SHL9_9HYPO|nr:hypothetical protein B0I35DRAFT_441934 [Stachybotrys elegans]